MQMESRSQAPTSKSFVVIATLLSFQRSRKSSSGRQPISFGLKMQETASNHRLNLTASAAIAFKADGQACRSEQAI
jgi:hypothetical protein